MPIDDYNTRYDYWKKAYCRTGMKTLEKRLHDADEMLRCYCLQTYPEAEMRGRVIVCMVSLKAERDAIVDRMARLSQAA
jgi:hypothetical protein